MKITGLALKYALAMKLSKAHTSWFRLTAGLVCLLWLGALAARATDHYVSLAGTNDSAGQYTNWAGAATQIQWAVDFATNGETVWVSNGTYNLTNTISTTNGIALRSLNGDCTNTIINGNYPAYTNVRGVYINNTRGNTRAVLDGFTITNCYGTNLWGVAIYATNTLITNCLITGNIATQGANGACGYVFNTTISHCRFIGNKSTRCCNVGLYIPLSVVSNCIFSGNDFTYVDIPTSKAQQGTVLNTAYTGGTIVNCVISSNIGHGVAFQLDYNYMPSLLSSIVSYNTGFGVAVMNLGIVRNCLIVQNGWYGIWMKTYSTYPPNKQIESCIIANNGNIGVYVELWDPRPSSSYIANSIIYNNKITNWAFVGSNMVYTNCCTIPIPTNFPGQPEGTGNITNAPLFTDTNIANYRLSVKSPCINAGTNQTWMINSSDLDGKTRIRYGRVDIGAYEYINKGTLYKFR